MKKRVFQFFCLTLLIPLLSCVVTSEFDKYFDADLSKKGGVAPLEVVAFVIAKVPIECVDITWRYWYSGFELDRNEVKERVCRRNMFTHTFVFPNPGKAYIEVVIKYQEKFFAKKFSVLVLEQGLPPGYTDWDKND